MQNPEPESKAEATFKAFVSHQTEVALKAFLPGRIEEHIILIGIALSHETAYRKYIYQYFSKKLAHEVKVYHISRDTSWGRTSVYIELKAKRSFMIGATYNLRVGKAIEHELTEQELLSYDADDFQYVGGTYEAKIINRTRMTFSLVIKTHNDEIFKQGKRLHVHLSKPPAPISLPYLD